MKLLKSFFLVVLSLVGQLWTGYFTRNHDFYDNHAVTKTKAGYIVFLALAFISTIMAIWLYLRVNQ